MWHNICQSTTSACGITMQMVFRHSKAFSSAPLSGSWTQTWLYLNQMPKAYCLTISVFMCHVAHVHLIAMMQSPPKCRQKRIHRQLYASGKLVWSLPSIFLFSTFQSQIAKDICASRTHLKPLEKLRTFFMRSWTLMLSFFLSANVAVLFKVEIVEPLWT